MHKIIFGRAIALVSLALLLVACAQQQTVPTQNGTLSVISHYFNATSVLSHKIGRATVSCGRGEQVVSGGFGTVGTSDSARVVYPLNKTVILASYPATTSSWTVVMLNREDQSITLAAHIQCSALANSQIITNVGSLNNTAVTANCPQNTQLLGGGFQVDQTAIKLLNSVPNITVSAPVNTTGWTTTMNPARGSSLATSTSSTTYAVCSSSKIKSTLGKSVKVTAPTPNKPSATDGYGTVGCPAEQLLLGAGFRFYDYEGHIDPYIFYADYSNTPLTWAFNFRSLVSSSIEGEPVNIGGEATLTPLCGTVSA